MSKIAPPRLVDPTRSVTLRKQFTLNTTKRFDQLQQRIKNLLLEEDALNGRWKYLSEADTLEQFDLWLREQIDSIILQKNTAMKDPWMVSHIRDAYMKGHDRSWLDVRSMEKKPVLYVKPTNNRKGKPVKRILTANDDQFEGARKEFKRTQTSKKSAQDKIKLLAAQAQSEFQSITEAVRKAIYDELLSGVIKRLDPRRIYRNIQDRVNKLGKFRSKQMAQTEITRAHAEGQLDALDALGITHVRVAVEWRTAGDNRVCAKCKPLEGIVLTTQEARGLIPRHYGCRCAFLPANVGEAISGQVRTYRGITDAIRRSVAADKKKDETWAGANVSIDRQRPAPLAVNYSPNQPRAPKGSSKGGQWVKGQGGGGVSGVIKSAAKFAAGLTGVAGLIYLTRRFGVGRVIRNPRVFETLWEGDTPKNQAIVNKVVKLITGAKKSKHHKKALEIANMADEISKKFNDNAWKLTESNLDEWKALADSAASGDSVSETDLINIYNSGKNILGHMQKQADKEAVAKYLKSVAEKDLKEKSWAELYDSLDFFEDSVDKGSKGYSVLAKEAAEQAAKTDFDDLVHEIPESQHLLDAHKIKGMYNILSQVSDIYKDGLKHKVEEAMTYGQHLEDALKNLKPVPGNYKKMSQTISGTLKHFSELMDVEKHNIKWQKPRLIPKKFDAQGMMNQVKAALGEALSLKNDYGMTSKEVPSLKHIHDLYDSASIVFEEHLSKVNSKLDTKATEKIIQALGEQAQKLEHEYSKIISAKNAPKFGHTPDLTDVLLPDPLKKKKPAWMDQEYTYMKFDSDGTFKVPKTKPLPEAFQKALSKLKKPPGVKQESFDMWMNHTKKELSLNPNKENLKFFQKEFKQIFPYKPVRVTVKIDGKSVKKTVPPDFLDKLLHIKVSMSKEGSKKMKEWKLAAYKKVILQPSKAPELLSQFQKKFGAPPSFWKNVENLKKYDRTPGQAPVRKMLEAMGRRYKITHVLTPEERVKLAAKMKEAKKTVVSELRSWGYDPKSKAQKERIRTAVAEAKVSFISALRQRKLERKLWKQAGDKKVNMTHDEYKVLLDYTGSYYTKLNRILRHPREFARIPIERKNLMSHARDLQGLLKRGKLKKPIVFWRGVSSDNLFNKLENSYKNDKPIVMKGFQSVTVKRSTAENFSASTRGKRIIMRIKGKTGFYFGGGEGEFLQPHGKAFRILKKVKPFKGSNAEIIYYLEEID